VVECTALEMRHRCKPIGGSNPSLSARNFGNSKKAKHRQPKKAAKIGAVWREARAVVCTPPNALEIAALCGELHGEQVSKWQEPIEPLSRRETEPGVF
jgi:hypothetical protein